MVRLKEGWAAYNRNKYRKFQFQYGAIKRHLLLNIENQLISFNSNMVRLKAVKDGKKNIVIQLFTI